MTINDLILSKEFKNLIRFLIHNDKVDMGLSLENDIYSFDDPSLNNYSIYLSDDTFLYQNEFLYKTADKLNFTNKLTVNETDLPLTVEKFLYLFGGQSLCYRNEEIKIPDALEWETEKMIRKSDE
jgi:hypothetical protein